MMRPRRRFRHRHRFAILLPGVVQMPGVDGLYRLDMLMCRCGAEDPDSRLLRESCGMVRP